MRNRVTRWTALFLLVMFGAAFGSMYCAADSQEANNAILAKTALQAQSSSDAAECPWATLAEFVAAPMAASIVPLASVMRPAYAAPLYLSPRYRVDPSPPLKPPAA